MDPWTANGFERVPAAVSATDCARWAALAQVDTGSVGDRRLLLQNWCADAALQLRKNPAIARRVPRGHVAVQCTFFEKSFAKNWLVPIHQDLSIPVADRVLDDRLQGWSVKDGQLFVQAPVDLLANMVALRIHLDACSHDDGPLLVVPGSHRLGHLQPDSACEVRRSSQEYVCTADVGDAMLMRPLLLHASTKSKGSSRRRVLHFLFGPADPGYGLRWAVPEISQVG
jgi:hypothetical protein